MFPFPFPFPDSGFRIPCFSAAPKTASEESPWWVEELVNDLFSVVIVNEAHHFPAPTGTRILNKFKQHAGVIFFTATPYRSDEQEPVVLDKTLWFHL